MSDDAELIDRCAQAVCDAFYRKLALPYRWKPDSCSKDEGLSDRHLDAFRKAARAALKIAIPPGFKVVAVSPPDPVVVE